MNDNGNIILIGFKHTGKSSIGYILSKNLGIDFIDLDEQIEKTYALQHDLTNSTLHCREIMQKHGEHFFRIMEHRILQKILQCTQTACKQPVKQPFHKPFLYQQTVVALGGGTPLKKENQMLLKSTSLKIIHITAPQSIVFERIISNRLILNNLSPNNSLPAFFPPDDDPYMAFIHLWKERHPVYQSLADYTVNNNKKIIDAVHEIINAIEIRP